MMAGKIYVNRRPFNVSFVQDVLHTKTTTTTIITIKIYNTSFVIFLVSFFTSAAPTTDGYKYYKIYARVGRRIKEITKTDKRRAVVAFKINGNIIFGGLFLVKKPKRHCSEQDIYTLYILVYINYTYVNNDDDDSELHSVESPVRNSNVRVL